MSIIKRDIEMQTDGSKAVALGLLAIAQAISRAVTLVEKIVEEENR